jgi:hypothetical protein
VGKGQSIKGSKLRNWSYSIAGIQFNAL